MTNTIPCPLCGNKSIQQQYVIKDHSVSKEEFPVASCNICELYFTENIPDEEAIKRYYQVEAYISHSDTSEGTINKLYHRIRKRTLKKKRKLIEKFCKKETGNLLDIGSGTGSFLHEMQDAGWQVTGIEPDEIARENSIRNNKIEALSPAAIHGLPSSSFDAITMWHVLEHVHKLHDQLNELKRLIKPSGKIFIAVPNHTSYDADHYQTYWAAWDVPRHLYHFSPQSMNFLAEHFGFEIVKIKPMWYDSFYVSMLSEKYKTGRSHIIRAFFQGLMSNLKAFFDTKKCSSITYILQKKN